MIRSKPTDGRSHPSDAESGGVLRDLAMVLVVLAVLIGISAAAPSDLQAYAQVWNIGPGVWVSPRGVTGSCRAARTESWPTSRRCFPG